MDTFIQILRHSPVYPSRDNAVIVEARSYASESWAAIRAGQCHQYCGVGADLPGFIGDLR